MPTDPRSPLRTQCQAGQALEREPMMAQLTARIRLSQQILDEVKQSVLPPKLSGTLKAGPITEAEWCILCGSNAIAAKLRQWLPDLQARVQHLTGKPLAVRIKVLAFSRRERSRPWG